MIPSIDKRVFNVKDKQVGACKLLGFYLIQVENLSSIIAANCLSVTKLGNCSHFTIQSVSVDQDIVVRVVILPR